MRALLSNLLVLLVVLPGGCVGRQEIAIRLHSGNEREVKAEAQLRRLLREYDLSPWFFTREVLIESGVVPHAYPVITLSTRYTDGRDERQLSTFLHEQIHWFLNVDEAALLATFGDLREMYPEVPVGRPEGSRTECSTYLHLIVCWFELEAMTKLIGSERARQVLGGKGYYTWVYRRVLEDTEKIGTLIRGQGLVIDDQGSR